MTRVQCLPSWEAALVRCGRVPWRGEVLEGLLGEVTFSWRPAGDRGDGLGKDCSGVGNGVNSHREGLEVES